MIRNLDQPLYVPEILDFLSAARKLPDRNKVMDLLIEIINSDPGLGIVLVDTKDGILRGVVAATKGLFNCDQTCFIQLAYFSPSTGGLCLEMINRVRSWAKKQGFNNIYMSQQTMPASFSKSCGFSVVKNVVKRRA